jgi:hypothetical protein
MIKKYNQFVKENKLNEDFEMESPVLEEPIVDDPLSQEPIVDGPLSQEPIVDEPIVDEPIQEPIENKVEQEEEEVEKSIYDIALEDLAEAALKNSAIVDFNEGDKIVVINNKKVTFPSEDGVYHIEGIKKGFKSIEDVLSNLGVSEKVPSERREEIKDEMTSLKDEEFLDSGEQFESKIFKNKRFKL